MTDSAMLRMEAAPVAWDGPGSTVRKASWFLLSLTKSTLGFTVIERRVEAHEAATFQKPVYNYDHIFHKIV